MRRLKKRIALIEKNPDTLFMISSLLIKFGYSTLRFNNALSIVDGLHQPPDLYVIDEDLATIDGIAVCKFLKLHPHTKHVPVILTSTYSIRDKAIDAGAENFFIKPFDSTSFLETVDALLFLDSEDGELSMIRATKASRQ